MYGLIYDNIPMGCLHEHWFGLCYSSDFIDRNNLNSQEGSENRFDQRPDNAEPGFATAKYCFELYAGSYYGGENDVVDEVVLRRRNQSKNLVGSNERGKSRSI